MFGRALPGAVRTPRRSPAPFGAPGASERPGLGSAGPAPSLPSSPRALLTPGWARRGTGSRRTCTGPGRSSPSRPAPSSSRSCSRCRRTSSWGRRTASVRHGSVRPGSARLIPRGGRYSLAAGARPGVGQVRGAVAEPGGAQGQEQRQRPPRGRRGPRAQLHGARGGRAQRAGASPRAASVRLCLRPPVPPSVPPALSSLTDANPPHPVSALHGGSAPPSGQGAAPRPPPAPAPGRPGALGQPRPHVAPGCCQQLPSGHPRSPAPAPEPVFPPGKLMGERVGPLDKSPRCRGAGLLGQRAAADRGKGALCSSGAAGAGVGSSRGRLRLGWCFVAAL